MAPYALLPEGFTPQARILFSTASPRWPKTCAAKRFATYRVAETVEEARSLGATTKDLKYDMKHGVMKFAPACHLPVAVRAAKTRQAVVEKAVCAERPAKRPSAVMNFHR